MMNVYNKSLKESNKVLNTNQEFNYSMKHIDMIDITVMNGTHIDNVNKSYCENFSTTSLIM
jgi:hypothetical protein